MPILDTDIAEIAGRLAAEAAPFAGRDVLVTGGAGFLGRYLVAVFQKLNRDVLDRPCRLRVLDNFRTAAGTEMAVGDPDIVFERADVIQPYLTDRPVDYVIHAAGIASPFYYRKYPLETLDVATVGTRNLLELARQKGARFTFMSSSEIYGDPDPKHVPTPESYRGHVASLGPRACYDEGKRVGETLCYIFHDSFGVHTNIIRPFNVFGPGMSETDYRVLPNFASRIKGGLPLQVYGDGRQTRTYCYVTDALVGMLKVVLSGVAGEAYNIGNPAPEISVLDLVKRIEQVLGRRVSHNAIEYPDSYPEDEPNRRCPDIRKARLQLDYEPAVTLEDGLDRFLRWADGAYRGVQ
ncbi:MAG: NAD-dependent epimerase/dehydratase family protein [Alphaproteobacteria bacterium]